MAGSPVPAPPANPPRVRAQAGVTAALVVSALVAGCGGGTSPPTPSRRPSPSAGVPTTVLPAPTPPAGSLPPTLAPAISGQPPFTFAVPPGWHVVEQDPNQVDLETGTSGSSAERIRLTLDVAQEQTAGDPTTTVAGHTAYVVSDGPSADGATYTRVLLIADGASLFELLCSGYSGYDRSRLTGGCDTFTSSVRFSH